MATKGRFLVYGFLLGTYGLKALTTPKAKEVYTKATAAVLRGADAVMKDVTVLKENCEDIYADAKEINNKKAKEVRKPAVIENKPAKASKKPVAKKK